ncbi:DMT family transporter [Desulfobulbus sp.]|uniref:DMT family transporter n=1 Tax=Desulfobulbus sp. TaxID=895 RepID=UPI00286F623B|nr:DMT family transporter [Desulfobulbus sp.]
MQSIKPVLAALTMVCIWSGWITLSRYGVHTDLQPADITLLRYWTALLVVAPFAVRYPWRRFRLWQHLVVGLGVGFPYTMLSFYGLTHVRAAHAGVVVNGMLPVLGAAAAWLLYRQRLSSHRYAAIGLIFIANFVMTGGSLLALDQAMGIALLLGAAGCYTCHMIGIHLYRMTWRDAVVIVPLVNVAIFTPLWYLFPTGLARAPLKDIAIQAGYQGVVVNVLALICVAYAIRHLGTITVSLFMSFVPVATALWAWLLLGEALTAWEFAGIAGCSLGLFWYFQEPKKTKVIDQTAASEKE